MAVITDVRTAPPEGGEPTASLITADGGRAEHSEVDVPSLEQMEATKKPNRTHR